MSKNNSYKPGPNDFLDYSEGKLKGRKRNAFERYLEQNLFDAEAAEGLEMVSREEAEQDLTAAGKQINRRINRRKRIGWYSAAAAVVTILAISTIFFNVDKSSLDKQEMVPELPKGMENVSEKKAAKGDPEQASPVVESEAIPEEVQEEDPVSEDKETPAELQQEEAVQQPEVSGADEEIVLDEVVLDEVVLDDDALEIDMEEAETIDFMAVEDDQEIVNAEPLEEAGVDAGKGEGNVEEVKVLQETVQAAPVSVEKSMRVSSAAKRSETAGAVTVEQVSGAVMAVESVQVAKPLEGMTAYMEYVNSELAFPSTELSRTSAIVEIKFFVLPGGRPYNIQTVSSPSQAFSDEVHSVITNGPDWIPAKSGGEYVEEEVSLKVEFGEEHKR